MLLGDTWAWDGTTWTHPTLKRASQARSGAGAACDARSATVVRFGGNAAFSGSAPTGDAWSLP